MHTFALAPTFSIWQRLAYLAAGVVTLIAALCGSTRAAVAAAADRPSVVTTVLATGQSIVVTQMDGGTANVMIPSNDAARGTTLEVRSVSPGPPADAANGGMALAELDLTASRTTKFWSLPSFFFTLPAGADARSPMLVELDDGDRFVAVIDQFHLGIASFVGEWWTRTGSSLEFALEGGHQYRAVLIARPPSMLEYATAVDPAPVALPPVNGIGFRFVEPSIVAGGANVSWRTTPTLPAGAPPFLSPNTKPLAYATVLFLGNVTFEGDATVQVDLPPEAAADATTPGLAIFEYPRWHAGWREIAAAFAPGDTPGRYVARVTLPNTRIAYRRYVFVLFRHSAPGAIGSPPATPPSPGPSPSAAARAITVVGDSSGLMSVLAPSAQNCSVDVGPSPICQYTADPALNYPGNLGRLLGADVLNLSWPTTELGADWTYGEAERTLEVPEIPPDARYVMVTGGFLDIVYDPKQDLPPRVDAIDAAIRARAPGAHLIYVGLRYMRDVSTNPVYAPLVPLIDAWNQRERTLAAAHGDLFIDYNALVPAGFPPDAPDGEHLTIEASRRVAASMARTIRAWPAWNP